MRLRRARLWLSACSTLILGLLVALHRVMDHRLDTGQWGDFYSLHRAYLIASTAQWLLNLGLLLVQARKGEG